MHRRTVFFAVLLGVLAAGVFYYRRHHFSKSFLDYPRVQDPSRPATGSSPQPMAGAPLDPSRSIPPNQLRSPETDRTLQTVQEINRINKLNSDQNPRPPRK